jgi:hypothetical protein
MLVKAPVLARERVRPVAITVSVDSDQRFTASRPATSTSYFSA